VAAVNAERPGFLPLNLIANLPRPPVIPDFMRREVKAPAGA
jgi:hypothetical protein